MAKRARGNRVTRAGNAARAAARGRTTGARGRAAATARMNARFSGASMG